MCQDIKEKGRRESSFAAQKPRPRARERWNRIEKYFGSSIGTFPNRCLDAGGHKEPWLFLASNVGSSTRSLSLPRGWDGRRRVELITVKRFARMAFVFEKRSNSGRLFVWEIVEKTEWVWKKYLRERRGSTPMEWGMKVIMRSEWNEMKEGRERKGCLDVIWNYFVILLNNNSRKSFVFIFSTN